MAARAALPLSQQILVWVLGALGYADDATVKIGVSGSTLKSARRGDPIPRSWGDLIDGALGALGAAPDEHLRSVVRALFRKWDEKVGALPPAADLSLADRAHALLARAIPEVGVRLGAIAALAAASAGTPIDAWSWLIEPFDARFFGRVVDALFRHRRPELKTDGQRKEALKREARIHGRTLERWRSGRVKVPVGARLDARLESLGSMFGAGAEARLRVARSACILREDLRAWIGDDGAAEWTGAVAEAGRLALRALSDPAEVAVLLQWVQMDLAGPGGDDLLACLRLMPLGDARAWSRQDLGARLASAAGELADGSTAVQPLALWTVGMTLLVHPRHLARVFSATDGEMSGLLPTTDFFRLAVAEWRLRSLTKIIASGGSFPPVRTAGASADRPISDRARDTARRLEVASLRFRHAGDAWPHDSEVREMLLEAFGAEALSASERNETGSPDPHLRFIEMFIDPTAATVLSDELVAVSRPLCLSRARTLAEHGNFAGALGWAQRARGLVGPVATHELDDLMTVSCAISHGLLDGHLRTAVLRTIPNDPDSDSASRRTALLEDVRILEEIVETALTQSAEVPDAEPAVLNALVTISPLAIRLAHLRAELSEDAGLERNMAETLVARLRACLHRHPTHGRGWAMVALCAARCGEAQSAGEAKKLAIHYGAAAFLEGEVEKIESDLILTEDAG